MARRRYTMEEELDERRRFSEEAASSPASLFKNAAGRAAYDALMPEPGQVRVNTPQEIAATTGPGLIRGAMAPRLPSPEQQLAAQRERLAMAELQQRDLESQRRYDLQQQALGLEAQQNQQRNFMDVVRTGSSIWEADADRARRAEEFERTGQQRAYEFEQEQGQRAYQFEQSRLPSQRDEFMAWEDRNARAEQQQFQAQEAQARHAMQVDMLQQELSQGEKLRLQKLQQAKAYVQEQVDAGQLTASEGADLMTQLNTGINPLVNRQARSQMLHQEMQNKLLQEQAAKQAAMDQMNRSFMAKGFAERVGTWTDPDTGHKFRVYESSPGKYDILPDKQAEMEERRAVQQEKAQEQYTKEWDEARKQREKVIEGLEKRKDTDLERWKKAYDEGEKAWQAEYDAEFKRADAANTNPNVVPNTAEMKKLKADKDFLIRAHMRERGVKDWSPEDIEARWLPHIQKVWDTPIESLMRRQASGLSESRGPQQGQQQQGQQQQRQQAPPARRPSQFNPGGGQWNPEEPPATPQATSSFGRGEDLSAPGLIENEPGLQGQTAGKVPTSTPEAAKPQASPFELLRQDLGRGDPVERAMLTRVVDKAEAMMERYGSREAMQKAGVLGEFDALLNRLREENPTDRKVRERGPAQPSVTDHFRRGTAGPY